MNDGLNKLSKLDEMEWPELFEAKKKEAQELKSEIKRVDGEIDRMAYELGACPDWRVTECGRLTEEEKILEGSKWKLRIWLKKQ